MDDPTSASDDGSDFDGDDASDDEGSGSDDDFGGDDSEGEVISMSCFVVVLKPSLGDDWDELERKAAKSDNKREANGKPAADSDSGSDRPKKKQPSKTNGKPVPKAKGKR